MDKSKILQQISHKNSDKNKIAEKVIKNTSLLSEIFVGLESPEARIKYGSNKVLMIISEKNPAVIYPKFNFFINQLDNGNNFLKWGAIEIIVNLCKADKAHHFENIFSKYVSPIHGHHMIAAANTIKAMKKIADTKHNLAEKIAEEVLSVENADYESDECNNIVISQAIKTLEDIFPIIKNKKNVLEFVQRQLKNKRAATRKKAETFLRKNQKLIKH